MCNLKPKKNKLSHTLNALPYFATVVSYARKMFLKLTPGKNFIIQYLVNYHNNSNPSFSRVKNCSNLLPFHGNFQGNIALQQRMAPLTWNGDKLPQKIVL